jgi:hypothetical protein
MRNPQRTKVFSTAIQNHNFDHTLNLDSSTHFCTQLLPTLVTLLLTASFCSLQPPYPLRPRRIHSQRKPTGTDCLHARTEFLPSTFLRIPIQHTPSTPLLTSSPPQHRIIVSSQRCLNPTAASIATPINSEASTASSAAHVLDPSPLHLLLAAE